LLAKSFFWRKCELSEQLVLVAGNECKLLGRIGNSTKRSRFSAKGDFVVPRSIWPRENLSEIFQ